MAPSANKPQLDLSQIPDASHYVLAYSGGVDSTALLHLLTQHPVFTGRLSAIHVNHNIHPDARLWAAHCQTQCDQLGVSLYSEQVNLESHSEQSARDARYEVFRKRLKPDHCLLTAHHQDDQLETLLFRLQRGTGLHGLCGMPLLATHEAFPIYRPLLNCSKVELEQWVNQHGWPCVQDPSNDNNQYSRNFIRNQLLPLMAEGNPQVRRNLMLTQKNLQQTAQLVQQLIGRDNPLKLPAIPDPEGMASFFYHWLTGLGIECPSHHRLLQFARDCLNAAQDKHPRMWFADHLLWCWGAQICCLDARMFNADLIPEDVQLGQHSVSLKSGLGALRLPAYTGEPLAVSIQYQQSQDKINLSGHDQRKRVKNLFQEDGIPPWDRAVLPFVYWQDRLVAVGNRYTDAGFKRHLEALNTHLAWQLTTVLR
jgi:tRNA(Ile)-lysidine synthase